MIFIQGHNVCFFWRCERSGHFPLPRNGRYQNSDHASTARHKKLRSADLAASEQYQPQARTLCPRHKANVYNILRRTGSMIAITETSPPLQFLG